MCIFWLDSISLYCVLWGVHVVKFLTSCQHLKFKRFFFLYNPDFQLLLKDVRRKKTFRYLLGSPQASSLSAYPRRSLSSQHWIYSHSSLNGIMFIYRPLDAGAKLPKYSSKALSAPSHLLTLLPPTTKPNFILSLCTFFPQ